ncbi:MAG: hypothetical protein AAGA54_33925 [Myxococcota bacterium]
MRPSFGLFLLVLPAFAPGCDEACEEYAAASVSLEVLDAKRQPIADADVRFTIDGGEERQAESFGDGAFVAGYEEDGRFEVTIEAADHTPAQRTYDVAFEADGCHVETVTDRIELEPDS